MLIYFYLQNHKTDTAEKVIKLLRPMLFIIFIIIYCPNEVFSQYHNLNLPEDQNHRAVSIVTVNDSTIMVCGEIRQVYDKQQGIYFLKMTTGGELLWENNYFSPSSIQLSSIDHIQDNKYILTGTTHASYEDIFQLELDDENNIINSSFLSYTRTEFGFKTQYRDGSKYILAFYRDGYLFIEGDVLLMKYTDGIRDWSVRSGENNIFQTAKDMVISDDGSIYIVGSSGGFERRTTWEFKNHDAENLLVKVNNNGQLIFRKTWGNSSHNMLSSIKEDDEGNLYCLGSSQTQVKEGFGSFDFELIKLTPNGEVIWSKRYGGNKWDMAQKLLIDHEQNLYILGNSASYSNDNKSKICLIKINIQGNIIWETVIGDDNESFKSKDIAITHNNDTYIVGYKNGGFNKDCSVLFKVDKTGEIKSLNTDKTTKNAISKIYSNPFENYINLSLDSVITYPSHFFMYSLDGKLLFEKIIQKQHSNISLNFLNSGVYHYSIISDKNIIHHGKIIKK